MPATRIKSQDIGASEVKTADILDANVTFSKLQVASSPALEDSTGIRVQTESGGGLSRQSGGLRLDGFRTAGSLTNAGDVLYDATPQQFKVTDALAERALSGVLEIKRTASATIASTAVESFFDSNQQYTIPANWFTVGRRCRITAFGKYGLDVAATMQLRMYVGGTQLVDTGAQSPITSASLNRNWYISFELFCITTGAGGTVTNGGFVLLPTTIVLPIANAAQALNTTAGALIQTSVDFSASTSTNRANMNGLIVEGS